MMKLDMKSLILITLRLRKEDLDANLDGILRSEQVLIKSETQSSSVAFHDSL